MSNVKLNVKLKTRKSEKKKNMPIKQIEQIERKEFFYIRLMNEWIKGLK